MKELNRFPKMMVLQYQRALKLGYQEAVAKAIGYAEALKYAIFKTKKYYKKSKKTKKSAAKSLLDIAKTREDKIFKLHFKVALPIVANKPITPNDFDREISRKNLTKEEFEKLNLWAKTIIENTDENILKNENKFFNLVWVKHRDDQIFK